MNLEIPTFTVRHVYGQRALYPVNRAARLFCALIHQKTAGPADLARWAHLGGEFHIDASSADNEAIHAAIDACHDTTKGV